MKWIIAFGVAAIVFGLLDGLWLRWAGPNLYRPALGDLLAAKFRFAPAALFYVIYIAGLVWFAVRPGLVYADPSVIMAGVPLAVLNGALLGGLAYATYDLTNQATLKQWATHITLIDIAWGASASALASGLATLAVLRSGY
ncbi:DUF2177 family protein [Novosphingobium sp.]|uniref:DUF2177 family protein n=1 Tax=Novosphingobium sp. TaxID=1874826 RepID=UPI0035B0C0F5